MADITTIDRDYSDNFAVKAFVSDELIAKYFPDVDVSIRTTGTIGLFSEQISNISEDAFNTASVYFREAFPNRAQIPESIYSHAAIFQYEDIFAVPAVCKFLIILKEEAIIANMVTNYDKDTGIYHFYIGRDTKIYVQGIPFSFDYTICINVVKKISDDGKEDYIFNANYVMDEYENTISKITDPYVKIRRSDNGYLAIEVQCHQLTREVLYKDITSNSIINYPVLDVPFSEYKGQLAGFEILYKAPGDSDFSTQLEKKVIYSQPVKNPFCYYNMHDENTLRISFNAKDGFWQPEFNSEVKIVLYITKGSGGVFKSYKGTDISMIYDTSEYIYANKYLIAARTLTSSDNGRDSVGLDALQAFAVEGYRTAEALTTEADLRFYFNNYKYRFGNSDILFIRKRDDVFERVWSAYIIMRNGSYIYKTNTLNLKLNISDMKLLEENVYLLEPGYLFTANESDGYATIYRDEEKHDAYYAEYLEAVEEGTIPFVTDPISPDEIPEYLNRAASFAEYKRRHNLDDKCSVFDTDPEIMKELDVPSEKKFLLANPFLIKFNKNPNLVSLYMTYIDENYSLDFINRNDSSYVQFIMYTMNIQRKFTKEKEYTITVELAPTTDIDNEYPPIQRAVIDEEGNTLDYIYDNKYILEENDLRVFAVIENNGYPSCYIEMYPDDFNSYTRNFTFKCDFRTDDHITSNNKLRLLDDTIYRNPEDGSYYKVHDDDATLYDYYDEDGNVLATDIPVDTITHLVEEEVIYKFSNVVNMTGVYDILVPIEDAVVRIYTLYSRVYSEETGQMEKAGEEYTDNIMYDFDKSLSGYFYTNRYETDTYPVSFMVPLDNSRVTLTFEDYTAVDKVVDGKKIYKHDIMDCKMYNIPFVKYDAVLNEDLVDYFMRTFHAQYNFLREIVESSLRNITILDTKLYNTYGGSVNFIIGEDEEQLDTVNLLLNMDIWFVPGTDLLTASNAVKDFIKEEVEVINEYGQNNLYISNLMRKIENTFAYVDHIRFNSINSYDTPYQAVKNKTQDISELSVEERRWYVPEFLVADVDRIILNEYYSDN